MHRTFNTIANRDVIVIGGNHHNTLAILRSLGEKGLRPMLIVLAEKKKPYVCYSKYISQCVVLTDEEQIADAMFSLRRTEGKPIVIACSDGISSYLDRNHDCLCKDFILPGSATQGRITELMQKNAMCALAKACGLTIPESWIVSGDDTDITEVEYPCIVKPLFSAKGTKDDIAICNNKQELQKHLSDCRGDDFQIQKFIDKDIEFQLIGCSLNNGEVVIIPGASIIIRQPQNTNTGFLKYIPERYFNWYKEGCKRFIRETTYSGLFSMEFLRGKDGRDYFMEINFRNDGNSICVTAAGINLPYIWVLGSLNESIDSELSYGKMREVLVMPEFDDIRNVKNRSLGLFQWLRDVIRTDRFMEFSKYDQKPFWIYIAQKLRLFPNS